MYGILPVTEAAAPFLAQSMHEIFTALSVVAYGLVVVFLGVLVLKSRRGGKFIASRGMKRLIEYLGNVDIR